MFTGIIEEVGKVSSIRTEDASIRLQIQTKEILKDIHIGDSIAVNGICLTVTKYDTDSFCADVMHETMNRTSLKLLRRGSKVNLERAMAANGRFGGHIVSGHIDGTGTIRKMQRDSIAIWYTIETTAGILRYIVEKGSITIDGISLTVAAVDDKTFQGSVIPHTLSHTALQEKKVGDPVNLETDCIGKYVEKFLRERNSNLQKPEGNTDRKNGKSSKSGGITAEFLERYGY